MSLGLQHSEVEPRFSRTEAKGPRYRCVATSVEALVRQVAVSYVCNGYWFYVFGRVPPHKDPTGVDRKLIGKYVIAVSPSARVRRKRRGDANIQYVRFGHEFLLLATRGAHAFFEEEQMRIRDVRRVAIRFGGYSIRWTNGHASIRLSDEHYRELRSKLLDMATQNRRTQTLESEFRKHRFSPYSPVRRQMFNIFRAVNARRKQGGLEPVPRTAVRFRPRVEPAPLVDYSNG